MINPFGSKGEYYDSFLRDQSAWVGANIQMEPPVAGTANWGGLNGASTEYSDAQWEYANKYATELEKLRAQWFETLPAGTKETALQSFADNEANTAAINKYGSMATKVLLGSIAGGAALTAAGVLGGTSAGSAAGTTAFDLAGAEAGLGYGGYGGAGGTVAGQAGMLGGTSIASGASVLGSAGVDLATAMGPATLGSSGSLGGLGGAAKAIGGSLLSGGATGGGGGGSAFRNTLTGEVSGTQESLNDKLAAGMDNQLAFNREQFDYYKGMSDKNYQLGQDTYNWNRGLADDAKARAARFDQLYFNTTGRQLQQFSNDVDAYNAPAEGMRMSGRAVADVEGQLDTARGAYQRGMTSRGWNPNSAAFQSSMGDMELQGALAKASASTMAYEAAKREGLNMRAMAAGLGQSNAGVATTNTGLSGQMSDSALEGANKGMAPGFTNLGLYNQGQGTAVNWGNAANSGFNAMRTGNSSWSDNMNYAGAIRGGLSGYANNGWLGGLAGAAGGLLSGG